MTVENAGGRTRYRSSNRHHLFIACAPRQAGVSALLVAKFERSMRPYLTSLIAGVAIGVVYGLIRVRSPAPPAIALLGFLGMLAGEQAVPLIKC